VNNIYQNLFGRDAGKEGIDFYRKGLENGEFTLQSIVKNVIDGAQNQDQTTLTNKMEVAEYFTDNLGTIPYQSDDIQAVRSVLTNINETPSSAQEAKTLAANTLQQMAEAGVITLSDLAGTYSLSAFTINYDSGEVLTEANVDNYSGTYVISEQGWMDQDLKINDTTFGLPQQPIELIDFNTFQSEYNEQSYMIDFNLEGNTLTTIANHILGSSYYEEDVWVEVSNEVSTQTMTEDMLDVIGVTDTAASSLGAEVSSFGV
jgi:hypothetical protein